MGNNVKIPLPLLSQTISLLEHLDVSGYDSAIRFDFDNVYMAFLKKRDSLELREAYSKIVFAESESARFEARMRYLKQKRVADDF
jgi:hypothetical protein